MREHEKEIGMNKTKLFFGLFLLVALSIYFGDTSKENWFTTSLSCSNKEKEMTTTKNSIVVAISQELDSLDPHKSVAAGTKEVLFNIYEGLVKPDPFGNFQDAVAKSHTISESGKVYTFLLREGVKFHNGAYVTAEDVKYSIERCAGITDGGTPLIPAFSNVKKVKIINENKIVLILKQPDLEFLSYLTVGIVPKGQTDYSKNPIGTGPFAFVSRVPQDYIQLKRFDGYWKKENQGNLELVTYRIITDSSALVNGLNSGVIQMATRMTVHEVQNVNLNVCNRLEGQSNLVQALYLNHNKPPFHQKEIRQALCYGIDRKEILDLTANGKGTVIGSSMFPSFQAYYMEELSNFYSYQPKRAKELLAKAGFPQGFSMTITVPANYQKHIDVALVLVEQLKKIGINASIELIEWERWLQDVYTDGKYEATVVGVDAPYLNARSMLERFTSTDARNFIHYNNSEYDTYFQKARASKTKEEQKKWYQKMQTCLTEDAANVYIQDISNQVILNKQYGGYVFYPLYVQDLSTIYKIEKE